MKVTTFMAAVGLLMQTACAQMGGGGGVSATPTPTSSQPAVVNGGGLVGGGGGFGGVNQIRRSVLTTDGNTSDAIYLLNANEFPREKGPYLGVVVNPVPGVARDQLKLQRGVGLVVSYIEKDSPAATAGLRENDILTKLDDQVMINVQQFQVLVRNHKLEEPVKLTVIREAKPMEVTAKLTERMLATLEQQATSASRLYDNVLNLNRSPATAQPFSYSPYDPFNAPSMQMESTDGQNTFAITRINGHSTVVATDKEGKTVFQGPIDTDEELQKVPKEIREKVMKLRDWPNGTGKSATTMPLKTLKILPPTPRPASSFKIRNEPVMY